MEEVTKKSILDRIEEKVGDGAGTWIDWQYLLDAFTLLRKVGVYLCVHVSVCPCVCVSMSLCVHVSVCPC